MANAIEMAISSALKRALDNLQDRIPEIIAGLPPDVMGHIGQIGKSVASFQASIDRVEANQRLIMDHLGIATTEQKVLPDGRQSEFPQ